MSSGGMGAAGCEDGAALRSLPRSSAQGGLNPAGPSDGPGGGLPRDMGERPPPRASALATSSLSDGQPAAVRGVFVQQPAPPPLSAARLFSGEVGTSAGGAGEPTPVPVPAALLPPLGALELLAVPEGSLGLGEWSVSPGSPRLSISRQAVVPSPSSPSLSRVPESQPLAPLPGPGGLVSSGELAAAERQGGSALLTSLALSSRGGLVSSVRSFEPGAALSREHECRSLASVLTLAGSFDREVFEPGAFAAQKGVADAARAQRLVSRNSRLAAATSAPSPSPAPATAFCASVRAFHARKPAYSTAVTLAPRSSASETPTSILSLSGTVTPHDVETSTSSSGPAANTRSMLRAGTGSSGKVTPLPTPPSLCDA